MWNCSFAKWGPFCSQPLVTEKTPSYRYKNPHYKPKTVWRPSKVYNGNPHDDIIKWKHFLRYWPFVWGIHRSPVNSPHKGQWRGALMFSLIYVWINSWVNNCEAGDLRCHCAHYDVIVMLYQWDSVFSGLNVTTQYMHKDSEYAT